MINEEKTTSEQKELVHSFEESSSESLFSMKYVVVLIIFVLLGLGSGYLLSRSGGKIGSVDLGGSIPSANSGAAKGTIVGSSDTSTFKDTVEGKLQNGGIEGEGQYHLVRPGGDSQNVYLTSSTVDLGLYVGRKIKVWGSTQTAQKAGWLMDVGRLEITE